MQRVHDRTTATVIKVSRPRRADFIAPSYKTKAT